MSIKSNSNSEHPNDANNISNNNLNNNESKIIDVEPVAKTVTQDHFNTLNDSNVKNDQSQVKTLRKQQKGFLSRLILPFLMLIIIFVSIVGIGFLIPSLNIITALAKITSSSGSSGNVIGDLFNLNPFASTEQELNKLQGASTGRINILLLGYGGEGHDGALLTDSQLIVSIFPKEKKIATVNIPRDTYVNDNGSYKKINSVYSDSEYKQKGSGAKRLSTILENELNSKINYWITIDFKGFKELVDKIGGIDINVRNSFTDYEYPLGDTYLYMSPAPSFTQGMTKMNGDKALIYSRSRHAAGVEGGDFARSLRQREVISAVARKAIDEGTLSNLGKLEGLISSLSNNLTTNLSVSEIYALGKVFKDYNLDKNPVSWTLADDNGILCPQNNPDTGYILIYCDGGMFGSGRISTSKTKFQKDFANILDVGIISKLKATDIAVVSNKSKVASLLQTNLNGLKAGSVLINNQYQSITLSENPQILAYLNDPNSEDVFNYILNQNLGLSIVRSGNLPSDKTLPKALSKAKIVFWIE